MYLPSIAQEQFTFNVLADIEFSRAGARSHFYYNEIHQDFTKVRVGLSQVNLLGSYQLNTNWSVKGRFLLERSLGQKIDAIRIPQLSLQWLSKDRRSAITFGRFINPFGSFNEQQLALDRNFVGLPLAYSYYSNISDKIGFLPGMGDITKIAVEEEVQWGTSTLYYGGYTTGMMWSWAIDPAKANWKIALVSGAANVSASFSEPLNYGLISRLQLQPKYFWEQGFSVSYGSFMQASELSNELTKLRQFTQTLVGTDFKLGYGFFELSGELIAAFYKVPVFSENQNDFTANIAKLAQWSAYADLKYELKILPGSYLAYRIDHLDFFNSEFNQNQDWDNDVLRHSLAFGYSINKYVLLRLYASTQRVDQKDWNRSQRTFRAVLTLHY